MKKITTYSQKKNYTQEPAMPNTFRQFLFFERRPHKGLLMLFVCLLCTDVVYGQWDNDANRYFFNKDEGNYTLKLSINRTVATPVGDKSENIVRWYPSSENLTTWKNEFNTVKIIHNLEIGSSSENSATIKAIPTFQSTAIFEKEVTFNNDAPVFNAGATFNTDAPVFNAGISIPGIANFSGGASFSTGNVTFDGNSDVSIGGELTAAGQVIVTGLVTAQGGISVADDKKIKAETIEVRGEIKTKKLTIQPTGGNWGDFVFSKEYNLMPLDQVKGYINEHGHLPEVPSAREVQDNGVDVYEMQRITMIKVEELTLHMIRLEQENANLKAQLEQFTKSK